MSLIGRVRNWLRSIAARRRLEREMLEEMAAHIEQAAERFRARGMSAADARLAARREFGQPGVVQEEARDARGTHWVDGLVKDLQYAARHFVRTPVTTVTIVLTLTLGIGALSSMFSITDGVFNRPLPGVPDDPSLVMIRGIQVDQDGLSGRSLSWPEVAEYAALTDKFSAVAAWETQPVTADFADGAVGATVRAQFVTPNLFATLGIRLATGPGFAQTRFDDFSTPELTGVVSQAFAARHVGGVEHAVGKEVRLNGVRVRIVGVTPGRFNGVTPGEHPYTVWLPLSSYPLVIRSSAHAFTSRDSSLFFAVGRLQTSASVAAATEAVKVVAAGVDARLRSAGRPAARADLVPLRGNMRVTGISAEDLLVSAGSGVMVLLILLVCTTTVSSLLVGAAVSRRQEIAVRLALGASRRRIVRQLLTENALLALSGGILGLLIFAWVCRLLATQLVDLDISPDWTTAGFTLVFAMGTALLCGLSPALHATRSGVADVLKDGAAGATARSRLQRTLVVAQVALTQPLLVGLAMMISMALGDFGSQRGSVVGDRIVYAEFDIPGKSPDPLADVMGRLGSLPGVVRVLPERRGGWPITLQIPSTGSIETTEISVRTSGVAPDYFRTLDIPIVLGREFMAADLVPGGPRPAIIGTDAAKQIFGQASPIGQRLKVSSARSGIDFVEIVGVVAHNEAGEDEGDPQFEVFVPYDPAGHRGSLLIRTAGPAEPLFPTLRAILQAEAPKVVLAEMRTLEKIARDRRREVLQVTGVSAGGGIIALLLASIGLYAVVAIGVGQRRREIGVRVALGAAPGQVVAMFFRGGLRLSLVGLVIGLPLSAAALKLLATQVGGPRTNMPAIALLIAAAVVAVAALATWLPARRATGVDPIIALRAE